MVNDINNNRDIIDNNDDDDYIDCDGNLTTAILVDKDDDG